jgi:ATP-dependent DNA ligase
VEHAEGHGDKLFEAVCKLGLEGIVSKKLDSPYRSGPSKAWIKFKNPRASSNSGAKWNFLDLVSIGLGRLG